MLFPILIGLKVGYKPVAWGVVPPEMLRIPGLDCKLF